MSAETAVVLEHEIARLRVAAPFRDVAPARLSEVLSASRLEFFGRGSVVLQPEAGAPLAKVLIMRQGTVLIRSLFQPVHSGHRDFTLGCGAILPLDAPRAEQYNCCDYVAAEDTWCWVLPREVFATLLDEPGVLRWFLENAWQRQDLLTEKCSADTQANQIAAQTMSLPLGSVVTRVPVTVSPSATIADAVALMARERIGSLVVADDGKPIGILTQSDALRRVFARGLDGSTTVGEAMTPAPAVLASSATVAEAALTMTTRLIRHIPVVDDDGQLAGMVSERDLFRMQRAGFDHFAAPIERAADADELQHAVARIREICGGMFLNGMAAEPLTALVSALNDRVVERMLELARAGADPGVKFCWMAFGSEGRHEQTFSTDQDNGIIFVAPEGEEVEAVRRRVLAFANVVNEGLGRCGFPLCKGDIMARNPDWCLTLDEWRRKFGAWIRTPTPEALLNASIFFDLRPLSGEAHLAEELRDFLLARARDNPLFLRTLAGNALEVSPPLGKFGRFATDGGEYGATLDLKKVGVRLFVDMARILALAHGVRATNTAQRLRLGGRKARRKPDAVEADIAAFHFIQAIRLRGQLTRPAGSTVDPNRVAPYALNEIDQRVLRESLRQAQLLQERFKMDYQL
ncbi:MAG: CBS domain-containing protein [Betaproteobacteria bacterium]|nr:CBS domain-containing protein [Betaproteobacteria bacterium]